MTVPASTSAAPSRPALSSSALYTLHLMSCALLGEQAQPIPEDATWERVFKLALSNSVATTCAFAATDKTQPWQAEVDKNLYRIVSFELERTQVFAAMDAAGLSHLPLKGTVIKDLYPRPEMRWMCDNDILYGAVEPSPNGGYAAHSTKTSMTTMRKIMENQGYKTVTLGTGNHESFEKEPIFNFEMHRGLANPEVDWWRYYQNPWQRARQMAENPHAFEFGPEDVYLFHIAHAYKHFAASGCGVRCIADEWVLLNAWDSTLDRAYIERELQKLDMTKFEAMLRHLAELVLQNDACGKFLSGSAEALDEQSAATLTYMLGSGTYGTVQNNVRNKLAKTQGEGTAAKVRYLLRRAFPTRESLELGYPIVKKHPWTIPGVYAYRLVVKPFTRHAKLKSELKTVAEYHAENGGER